MLETKRVSGKIWEKLYSISPHHIVSWETFTNACLYDESLGYYRKDKLRVGGENADFYTSVSLKQKVFSELIKESAKTILTQSGKDFADFEFYEIGAEPNRQIIENSKVARIGEKIDIPPSSIVISNELLDARPFERFVFQNGKWHKAFIQISAEDDAFLAAEILQAPLANEIAHIEKYFYPASVEGFRLDISFDALHLFEEICKIAKGGILIFADYFRTADEICHLPYGTARTYLKHTDTADFFIDATDCDITHSPCCDPLLDIAKKYFSNATEIPQEKFFLSNAENIIREITLDRNPFSARKRELAQLLSPVFMGATFRILFAF